MCHVWCIDEYNATNTHVNIKVATCDGTDEDITTNTHVNIKGILVMVLKKRQLQLHMWI